MILEHREYVRSAYVHPGRFIAVAGLAFVGAFFWSAQAQERQFVNVSSGAGLTVTNSFSAGNPMWTDLDNDGHLDVVVINHGTSITLLRNNGQGSFTDITGATGIPETSGDRHGGAVADFDNDGDQDIAVTLGGGALSGGKQNPDQLYQNEGGNLFTDIAQSAGVGNETGKGRSESWVDVDNDGDVDLFVENLSSDNILYRNDGNAEFNDIALAAGVIGDGKDSHSSWADYDNDGDMDIFTTGANGDRLLRNTAGVFSDVTTAAGLTQFQDGMGIAWGDYNNDGHVDLFIARSENGDLSGGLTNTSGTINFHHISASSQEVGFDFRVNGSEATFDIYVDGCRSAAEIFIGGQAENPPTVPFTLLADQVSGKPNFVPGQDLGLFIWRAGESWRVRWSNDGNTKDFYGQVTSNGAVRRVRPVNLDLPEPSPNNTLYRNNGDGTFTDVSVEAGVGMVGEHRGAVWGDYDNDGFLDLYVVDSGSFSGNAPNLLFRNRGDGTFEEVAQTSGVRAQTEGRGDGAAWGDYDNDGFLDLYLTNGAARAVRSRAGNEECLVHGPHRLFKNLGNTNNWLKLDLVGTQSNRDGIGARISLQTAGGMQFRQVNGGGGGQFFSQGGGPAHFGLGDETVVEILTIDWPSGVQQILTDLAAGQHITVQEPGI